MWRNNRKNFGKKMNKKQNIKKILSSCVVVSMVLTAFVTMLTIQAPSINADNGNGMNGTPSVRIYGEQNAVYPTQSYTGSEDFIYPSEEDPFDPGIIEKDSITFNPAFWYGHDEFEIKARGDASEKIFLRAFYEPGYTHDPDDLMGGCGATLEPVEQFDAIVTETTYFLTTLDDIQPNYGLEDQTMLALPYKSHDPEDPNNQPGMDVAGLLSVTDIWGGPTGKYCRAPYPDASLTDGGIRVEKMYEFDNIDLGIEDVAVRFMDHKVIFKNFEHQDGPNDKLDIEVWYTGNMDDKASAKESGHHSIFENSWGSHHEYNYYFNRDNRKQGASPGTDACHRWFLRIENADDDYLRFVCGRWLIAGETFYVDGVRYDIPAVYVNSEEGSRCWEWEHQFKYITLQSPIPKGGPPIWESPFSDNIKDFSHVSSQYLAKLPMQVAAWLLPPFNEQHVMIDDIGLPLRRGVCMDEEEIRGLILENKRDPLEIIYIDEAIEERFESSLMERLNTDDEDIESWYWYNVYTKPNRFTEFILPDQEMFMDSYEDIEDYYLGYCADGNEYLITTSFIAPNSRVSTYRCDNCKKNYDEHEILDRVLDIARNGERADYYEMPRFVFEFDADNCDDFFVNEQPQEPSVRIYGEQEFEYPTQSWTGANDFIYRQEEDPFDPGVIKKDSITFNSALWYGHEEPPFGYEIKAQGNAGEKIFLRAFYEPYYTHEEDDLMDACSNVILKPVEPFDAIVTETTYFLVTLDERQPTTGYPDTTKMVLPYESIDEYNPGMENASLVDVIWTDNKGTPQLTDGAITVEKKFEFEATDPYIGQTIQFMDHKVKFLNFENNDPNEDKLDVRVSYAGNMHDRLSSAETHTIKNGETKTKLWFDRANLQDDPDACHRWYMYIDSVSETYLRIYLGRTLSAGETFYVDGVRYDMPAVYVNGTDSPDDKDGFKYITFQTPIPKTDHFDIWRSPLKNNIDDFSHVSSQYLASLPAYEAAWLLPPFNEQYVMIDDIGLQKNFPHSDIEENCLPSAGIILKDVKDPIEMYWILEAEEERFESSLVERLNTCEESGNEEWCWWNIYTRPNRFTELIISDQETTDDDYDPDDLGNYPYTKADGNEYLITTSLIAPNSEKDDDRSNECKDFDEHEIISSSVLGGGNSVSAQIAMVLDGSDSIETDDWNIMLNGLADAVRNYIPRGVEFTVIQFSSGLSGWARVEVYPVVITTDNYQDIADQVLAINQDKGYTPLAAGIDLAADMLAINAADYERQIVNIVTDGLPNRPYTDPEGAAVTARNNMINRIDLNFDADEDEIDVEAVGLQLNVDWLRDSIAWPGSYDDWPPTGPGWVRVVEDYTEFAETIGEKFELLFAAYDPRMTYEFDASDGTGLYINCVDIEFPPIALAVGEDGCTGASVQFDGSGSSDPDGDITEYVWDFGDNSPFGSGMMPTHIYNSADTYTVTLTVTDDDSLTDTDTTTVTIEDCGDKPIAVPGGPYAKDTGADVEFDGSGSYDPDNIPPDDGIDQYIWDFGDGSPLGITVNPTHAYAAGEYTVTLTVIDDEGVSSDPAYTMAYIGMPVGTVTMEDVHIPCDPGTYYGNLEATGFTGYQVGSCSITLHYDSNKVVVTSVNGYDFDDMQFIIDNINGRVILPGSMFLDNWLTGDFTIARIGFQRLGTEDCPLEIDPASYILTDDSIPDYIPFTRENGYAYVECVTPPSGGVLGDMNGNDVFDMGDVRYLAIYIASGGTHPEYRPLYADGDVNSDGFLNMGDARYLAIYYASGGTIPEYSPLYP